MPMSPSESGTAMEGRPSARNSIARQRTPSSEKKTGSLAAGSRSQRRADLPTGRHGGLRAADPTSGGAGAGILVDKAAPPRVSRQRRAGVALPHLCGGRPARAAALDGADAVHDQDHETVCCRRPYAACALPEAAHLGDWLSQGLVVWGLAPAHLDGHSVRGQRHDPATCALQAEPREDGLLHTARLRVCAAVHVRSGEGPGARAAHVRALTSPIWCPSARLLASAHTRRGPWRCLRTAGLHLPKRHPRRGAAAAHLERERQAAADCLGGFFSARSSSSRRAEALRGGGTSRMAPFVAAPPPDEGGVRFGRRPCPNLPILENPAACRGPFRPRGRPRDHPTSPRCRRRCTRRRVACTRYSPSPPSSRLSALVCLGFKTEWSSLLLAVILFLSNLYMCAGWAALAKSAHGGGRAVGGWHARGRTRTEDRGWHATPPRCSGPAAVPILLRGTHSGRSASRSRTFTGTTSSRRSRCARSLACRKELAPATWPAPRRVWAPRAAGVAVPHPSLANPPPYPSPAPALAPLHVSEAPGYGGPSMPNGHEEGHLGYSACWRGLSLGWKLEAPAWASVDVFLAVRGWAPPKARCYSPRGKSGQDGLVLQLRSRRSDSCSWLVALEAQCREVVSGIDEAEWLLRIGCTCASQVVSFTRRDIELRRPESSRTRCLAAPGSTGRAYILYTSDVLVAAPRACVPRQCAAFPAPP
eukprot:scaffold9124_cov101-Isochrysis_galbana.AAC.5